MPEHARHVLLRALPAALPAGDTGITLPAVSTRERAALIALGASRSAWVRWRLGVFTDWVREFDAIRDEARPSALLGTFHNPWSDDGPRRRAPREARHRPAGAGRLHRRLQPDAVSRAVRPCRRSSLDLAPGALAGAAPRHRRARRANAIASGRSSRSRTGASPCRWRRSPPCSTEGARPPATGVMVFAWGGLRSSPEKIEAIGRTFRAMGPPSPDGLRGPKRGTP